MLWRLPLFFASLVAVVLLSDLSRLESSLRKNDDGPLCRLTAVRASKLFLLGTGWGGDDIAVDTIRRDRHLLACVRAASGAHEDGDETITGMLFSILGLKRRK